MLISNPHLLVKQPGQSKFGDWIYLPTHIKFSRRPKPEYQIVAAFQAMVLAAVQGVWPETARLILRSNKIYTLDLQKWVPQMQASLEQCIQTLLSPQAPDVFISRQRCSFCQWYTHCYAHAKSHQHLSLLPGVSPSRYQILQSLGLTTVESLASALPSQLEPAFGNEVAAALVRQAQSVVQNRAILITEPEGDRAPSPSPENTPSPPTNKNSSLSSPYPRETEEEQTSLSPLLVKTAVVGGGMAEEEILFRGNGAAQLAAPDLAARSHVGNGYSAQSNGGMAKGISEAGEIIRPFKYRNTLPTAPVELYFDIEAEPELTLDYLLGVLVVDRVAQTQTFHPLLAEQPAQEELIWQQFLELVWTYPNAPIFHFSPYEADTLKRLAKLYKTPASIVSPVLSRFVDVHNRVMGAVTLPVESYSLKAIASWLNFEWRDPQASGSQSIFWYDQWLKTGDRSCLDAIVRYNEDDCRATHHVKEWLVNFLQEIDPY